MSRAALRPALAGRGRAIAPLIGRHAARLEQVEPAVFRTDPETQARALRSTQALYGTDAVTICAGLDGLAEAAAAGDVEAAVAQPVIRAMVEAIPRLRPVLGERAGIAVVLPSPGLLEQQLGGDRARANALLMRCLRLIGAEEPDLVLMVGGDDPGPRYATLCEHFGMAWLALGAVLPAHVAAMPGEAFAGSDGRAAFITTTSEIPADAEPGAIRSAIERMREREG